jgi:uncharacterized membrane protein
MVLEDLVNKIVQYAVAGIDVFGTIVVVHGSIWALYVYLRDEVPGHGESHLTAVRLGLAHKLALALEFWLAGDVLKTIISPTFVALGQLAALALLRTVLNLFLEREVERIEAGERPGETSDGHCCHIASGERATVAR